MSILQDGVASERTAAADDFSVEMTIDAGLRLYDVQISWGEDSGRGRIPRPSRTSSVAT